MTTHLTLSDLLLVARLQRRAISLCPIEALVHPQLPVWTALRSLLPLDETRAITFVLDEVRGDGRHLQGFIQAVQSSAHPEMYIRNISPHLDGEQEAGKDSRTVWSRLINHIVSEAGERRLQRIYGVVPDGGEALEVLHSLGFSVYTREEIWQLGPDAHPQAAAQVGIRPEQSTDVFRLNQLYREVVPHLVQQAEALAENRGIEAICGPVAWEQGEGFVLEHNSEVRGYGHLTPGRTGHWLTWLVHPSAYDESARLVDYGLALLNYYPPLPVYCAVREYQGGVRSPLQERGFAPLSLQCRMVKHTTVRVTEPARALVTALETRAEVSRPTASRSE